MKTPGMLKRGAVVTAIAASFIGGAEGLRTVAYRDPIGIPTICFGETRGVKMGDRATVEECRTMLVDGLVEFEARMASCLKAPERIRDTTYVSMLSVSWNIGTGAFCKSTMARRLNAGDIRGACDALLAWSKVRIAGKLVTLPGLLNRRKAEREMCLKEAF